MHGVHTLAPRDSRHVYAVAARLQQLLQGYALPHRVGYAGQHGVEGGVVDGIHVAREASVQPAVRVEYRRHVNNFGGKLGPNKRRSGGKRRQGSYVRAPSDDCGILQPPWQRSAA
jgi:hypothetical protein